MYNYWGTINHVHQDYTRRVFLYTFILDWIWLNSNTCTISVTQSTNLYQFIHGYVFRLLLRDITRPFIKVFFCGAVTQRGSLPPHSWGFLDHTQWRTTFGMIPLDEWSARRTDNYLTTHNTHNRKNPCQRWDSNPRSQQASGCRSTS